jgi:hypothetical protein
MTSAPSPPGGWRKSSYSGSGNNCVEVAATGPAVAVRDSKHPSETLTFTAPQWQAFTKAMKTRKLRHG